MIRGLTNKVAVITGANSGMGLATVHRFMKEGASVIAFDKSIDTVKDITHSVKGDVSKMADLDRLYAEIHDKYGKVDVVFANAGICQLAPYEKTSEDFFDRTMNVNVKGVFFTVQKALPLMNDNGSIIMTGSIGGVKGLDQLSVYCATKAAVRSFARSMANELRHRKIRANVISPGGIDTPILFNSNPELKMSVQDYSANGLSDNIPAGRMGTPDEIASVAYFLATAESSYINGVDLQVDGGMVQV